MFVETESKSKGKPGMPKGKRFHLLHCRNFIIRLPIEHLSHSVVIKCVPQNPIP